MKVFRGGLKSMEISVQWKLWKDFSTFKFHVKKDGVKKFILASVEMMMEKESSLNEPSQMYPCPIRPHNKSEQWWQ